MRRSRTDADPATVVRRAPDRRGALLLLIATLVACAVVDDPGEPAATALRLFELADLDEPSTEQLDATFDLEGDEEARAVLLDALEGLPPREELRVVEITRAAGPDDAFVDLEARLPGGGEARFSVRLRAVEPGSWRVRWFGGPGTEWPPTRGSNRDGLSTSAPPDPLR